jgi:photosystem II stability/assembly factor-like uncharacterized protein
VRPRPSNIITIAIVVTIVAATGIAISSNWSTDPFANDPVCNAPYDEYNPQIIADGEGGVVIAWDDQRHPTPPLVAIDMIDGANGYALGEFDHVLKTTDSWNTIEYQPIPTTERLTDLSFASPDTGTVVGYGGIVYRTIDGGDSWTPQSSGTAYPLTGVYFVDAMTGWAVGLQGTILHTTDGGANWSPQTSGTTNELYGVDFVDANNGWVSGVGGTILHTTNGGSAWNPQSSGYFGYLFDIDFTDLSYGVAVGDVGAIFFTDDGGLIWQNVSGVAFDDLLCVEYNPGSPTVFAVGRGGQVIVSHDWGQNWNFPSFPWASDDFSGVSYGNVDTLAIVGDNSVVHWSEDDGVTWDTRGYGREVYAQRLDADGDAVWTTDGVPLSTARMNQAYAYLATDGDAGAIVVWIDDRNGYPNIDVYAQRVDRDGNVRWAADGTPVCSDTGLQSNPRVVTDQNYGAYVVWEDQRGADEDVYAQRVDSSGAVQWTPNGILLCSAADDQQTTRVAADGFGCALVTWQDHRNGYWEIYAQKVDAGGGKVWGGDGTIVSGNPSASCYDAEVAPDGFGGAVVVWQEYEVGPGEKLVVQRISSAGPRLWAASGVTICDVGVGIGECEIISDGEGGAIVAWIDGRTGHHKVYAQRVLFEGTIRWDTDGISVCDVDVPQDIPALIPDDAGGAYVFWEDYRNGYGDIYAQRLTSDGSRDWDLYGVLVCGDMGYQYSVRAANDGAGGVVATWQDGRNGSSDIYAQRIDQHGYPGDPAPVITSVSDAPGDQGGTAVVTWERSYLDVSPNNAVLEYSVWRRSQTPGVVASGRVSGGGVESAAGLERALADNIDQLLAASMAQSGWVYLDKTTAYYLERYAYDAPTYGDSTGGGIPYTGYMVIAHGQSQFVFWKSGPDSGYSVDNVSPGAPLSLYGEPVGSDASLTWIASGVDDEDLSHYAVYRSASPGFTPGPGTFLDTAPDTLYLDTNTGGASFYYQVSAVDIHENESDPSNEVYVDIMTGVENRTPALPATFTVRPNSPNPFGRVTNIRYGLPHGSDVTIEVYDVAGRRVFADRLAAVPAGWHGYTFAGVDHSGRRLSSGVYYYRVVATGKSMTQKMVIVR